nr:MAG TPA: hypothetical protein [Caudoviricetes sp.]
MLKALAVKLRMLIYNIFPYPMLSWHKYTGHKTKRT